MVSAEGACAAYYAYGRHLKPQSADVVQLEVMTHANG
jgi:hydrogenase expression/formation protein HypD